MLLVNSILPGEADRNFPQVRPLLKNWLALLRSQSFPLGSIWNSLRSQSSPIGCIKNFLTEISVISTKIYFIPCLHSDQCEWWKYSCSIYNVLWNVMTSPSQGVICNNDIGNLIYLDMQQVSYVIDDLFIARSKWRVECKLASSITLILE